MAHPLPAQLCQLFFDIFTLTPSEHSNYHLIKLV